MDTSEPKSNGKRQREHKTGSDTQRKSRRLLDKGQSSSMSSDEPVEPAEPIEPADQFEEPLKITDVNDNCLENIFMRLDLHDLFNVAVASEWLRPTAGVVYKRKCGQKTVYLRNVANIQNSGLNEQDDKIFVDGLKTCLQFLRCLGPSIDYLSIFYYNTWNAKQCDHIHHYIDEHCAETLVRIEFWDKRSRNQVIRFAKPLVNVRTVKVVNSDLRHQFPSFAKWFPNVVSLKLDKVWSFRCTKSPIFEHLTELHIDINRNTNDGTVQLMRLCPELQSLDFHLPFSNRVTLNQILSTIDGNPNIRDLNIDQPNSFSVTMREVQRLVDEHSSLVNLELCDFQFMADAVLLLLAQLNALKYAKLQMTCHHQHDRLVSLLDDEWQLTTRRSEASRIDEQEITVELKRLDLQ